MTKITLVVGLCVLGVAGVASAAPSEPAGKRAQLQVMDTRPLVVRGVGFVANERVHVLVATGGRSQSKMKLASRTGAFSLGFQVSVGSCGGFVLQAFGSRGSRAYVFPRRPQLDCVAPCSTTPRAPDGMT